MGIEVDRYIFREEPLTSDLVACLKVDLRTDVEVTVQVEEDDVWLGLLLLRGEPSEMLRFLGNEDRMRTMGSMSALFNRVHDWAGHSGDVSIPVARLARRYWIVNITDQGDPRHVNVSTLFLLNDLILAGLYRYYSAMSSDNGGRDLDAAYTIIEEMRSSLDLGVMSSECGWMMECVDLISQVQHECIASRLKIFNINCIVTPIFHSLPKRIN